MTFDDDRFRHLTAISKNSLHTELRISFTSKGLGCLRLGSNLPSRKQSLILSDLTAVFREEIVVDTLLKSEL